MNREMEWNAEVTKIHHTNYVRNSRAITVAWFVFSACYTILNIIAFIQPFWFGDTKESPGVGYFGLFERCERVQGSDYRCEGQFVDFNTILNDYFRAASFLVGGACLLFIFSIIAMLLFLFLKARIVLKLCGILQLIAAVFMAVACIVYPSGFDDDYVRRICGQDATGYNMDKCQIRWAFILAIVLIFDALILAVLAFVLAARQAKMFPEFKKLKEEKSQMPYGFSTQLDPPAVRQQAAKQRYNYPSVESSSYRHSQPNSNQPVSSTLDVEPLIIPVDKFEDSSSSSDPASSRSNEGSNSVRSRKSNGSRSHKANQDSPKSEGSQRSNSSQRAPSQQAFPSVSSSPKHLRQESEWSRSSSKSSRSSASWDHGFENKASETEDIHL